MAAKNSLYQYLDDDISFSSHKATQVRTVYFPLCGTDAHSIKSSITPFLGGDIKIDKDHYLTKPVSTEDLRWGLRNCFVYVNERQVVSLVNHHQWDKTSSVHIGQLWHTLVTQYPQEGLELQALNFVPVTGETIELMRVTIKNISQGNVTIIPTIAIPIFARALANKHDHEHVTSLLHRIQQFPQGVLVSPTMSFNEGGHQSHDKIYFVFAVDDKKENPLGTFPTVDSYCGDNGTFLNPEAVIKNCSSSLLTDEALQGKEAVGALRFQKEELLAGQFKEYFLVMGIADSQKAAKEILKDFDSSHKFQQALEKNKKFWHEKSHGVSFKTADKEYDSWMRWVTIQPVLRRIYGCSFLPDHDYGKGGKGWRDLWQDLLSLIIIEPENIRDNLINNFKGVRIDGSNATIIGSYAGEFLADRNAMSRVWMDHGAWPLLTLMLYIHQTGDYDILLEEVIYFRDQELSRAFEKDQRWDYEYGKKLKDKKGRIYTGFIIEHILIQNLVQFFNVGEHNITRLEHADWNDGLDMAFERGESVTFMSFYGGNLLVLAEMLEALSNQKNIKELTLAKEVLSLMDSLTKKNVNYGNARKKRNHLFNVYFRSVQPEVSGKKIKVKIKDITKDLRKKGNWIFEHIRSQEKITVKFKGKKYSWFNGYYDNKGKQVEGLRGNRIWMTLTGQVFPIMSGLATKEDIEASVESVAEFLRDKKLGGFRLNTDFGLRHYLDLGRAFGFAYGTKENGSFFSHMVVMYAYGLYLRGFVKEGYEVLRSIYQMCMDTEKSKIYPGVPEYFDSNGRGMYHYLTGSASWWVLTSLTQVFGVRGDKGDLILSPKLVKEEFDLIGQAQVICKFAGKKIKVMYLNKKHLDYDKYSIKEVSLNGKKVEVQFSTPLTVKIDRTVIKRASSDYLELAVVLS